MLKKEYNNYYLTSLTERQKAKTRKYSVIEGSAASVMSGAGDAYITPYAVELKANNAEVGLLTSFTGLLGPISQIFGSRIMEKWHRKKIVTLAVILHATMWLAILSLGFFFLKYGKTGYLIPLLIVAYVLYSIFGSFGGPAWFSLMGDIVPEKMRGRYFSNRNKICGAFSVIATILGSIWLYYTREGGIIIYGFIILFAIAAVSRYISAYFFSKHYVTKIKLDKGYYFSFFQFLKNSPYNNFGRFTILISLVTLSVNIAGPFFAVYMWKDLNFNPIWFMAVNTSAGVFSILFMPLWGKFADKYGNRRLLLLGGMLVSIMPFLWLISPNPIYLILVPQLISGIGWSAFNLGASNFIYDAVTVQRRALCVAYYSLLNGIGVFAGATIGGLLTQYAPIHFMNIFLFVFVISGIVRIISLLFMLPKIKEVKQVKSLKLNPFIYLKDSRHNNLADSKMMHGHLGEKELFIYHYKK